MSEKLSKLGENFKQEWTPFFITPTFCVLPWLQLPIGPQEQNVSLCTHSCNKTLKTPDGQPYSFTKHTLDEIWNGKSMREIRKKMLTGKKVENCQRCYNFEAIGKISIRNWRNQQWLGSSSKSRVPILNKVRKSSKNDYKTTPPEILDISFGNLCNLQCRMCGPENSSKIQNELEQLSKQYKKEMSYLSVDLEMLKKSKNWYKNSRFLENVYRWTPDLKEILFIGGEPVLIKEVWELIEYIKKNGYAKNIALQMNINCTYVPKKLLDAFNHFKKVILRLSIDGYKEVQEYIRYPSKWEVIEKNVMSILKEKNKNTEVVIYPTLQIYNIFNITELFQWANKFHQVDNVFLFSDHLVMGHKKLDIDILPRHIKEICLNKILDFEKKCFSPITEDEKYRIGFFYNGLKTLKNLLKRDPPSDSQYHLAEFRKYTEMLDKSRGNSFQKTFPELYELLEEDGSWRQ